MDGVTATLNLREVAEPLLLGPGWSEAQELGAEHAVNKPSTVSQSMEKTPTTKAFSLLIEESIKTLGFNGCIQQGDNKEKALRGLLRTL